MPRGKKRKFYGNKWTKLAQENQAPQPTPAQTESLIQLINHLLLRLTILKKDLA